MLLVLSKHSLLDDICKRHLLIDSGMFLRMEGGWLDCLCTYNGTFPSFVYGRCFPVFRSRVTSKKQEVASNLKLRLFVLLINSFLSQKSRLNLICLHYE